MKPMTSETPRIRQRRGSGVYDGSSTHGASTASSVTSPPCPAGGRRKRQARACPPQLASLVATACRSARRTASSTGGRMSSHSTAYDPLIDGEAGRAREEPDVEVRRAVAPAVDVHAADPGQALDDPDQAVGDPAELGGEVVVDLSRVLVLTGRQHQDERQAGGLGLGGEHPVLVLPDDPLGVEAGARVAGSAALVADPGLLDARVRPGPSVRSRRRRPPRGRSPTRRSAVRAGGRHWTQRGRGRGSRRQTPAWRHCASPTCVVRQHPRTIGA